MKLHRPTWDIFCRVVDNFGDIGVCWRLARQLANEYPLQVRLWVDDLVPLTQLCPGATLAPQQQLEQVAIHKWTSPFGSFGAPADVIIEAFGCTLPDSYLAAMRARTTAPLWINLEYLSAESWIEDCHQMPSIHPQLGLKKTFFFPGFTRATGGLLREQDLLAEQHSFDATARGALLQRLSVIDQGQCLISLFSYENPAVGALLDTWREGATPITCLIPNGKILSSVNRYLHQCLQPGDSYHDGNLQLVVLPFLPQTDYDRLLWLCDVNFVRGEDSFVRAQWAGKPFIWHIYPQEENAHQVKLTAFLERFNQSADTDVAQSVSRLWQSWNGGESSVERDGGSCAAAWNQCMKQYPQWLNHCQTWREEQLSAGDLAAKLVELSQKTL